MFHHGNFIILIYFDYIDPSPRDFFQNIFKPLPILKEKETACKSFTKETWGPLRCWLTLAFWKPTQQVAILTSEGPLSTDYLSISTHHTYSLMNRQQQLLVKNQFPSLKVTRKVTLELHSGTSGGYILYFEGKKIFCSERMAWSRCLGKTLKFNMEKC